LNPLSGTPNVSISLNAPANYMAPRATKDFQEYAVYRHRLRDLMHLFLLYREVHLGTAQFADFPGADSEALADTLHTAAFGWLASLIDPHPSAVNVFPLWLRLFPSRTADIERVRVTLAPCAKALTSFRGTVAFHGNKSLAQHLRAYQALRNSAFSAPTQEFLDLAKSLLAEEASVSGLVPYLEQLGL
jgi:hypothetical protein